MVDNARAWDSDATFTRRELSERLRKETACLFLEDLLEEGIARVRATEGITKNRSHWIGRKNTQKVCTGGNRRTRAGGRGSAVE